MVMVHDDVTEIFGRVFGKKFSAGGGIGIGFVLFVQKLHGHQGIQQPFHAIDGPIDLLGNLPGGSSPVTDNGKHIQFNGCLQHAGLPEKT